MGRRKKEAEGETERLDLSSSFQNRPPNISLFTPLYASRWKGHSFPPLFPASLLTSLILLPELFRPENKNKSSHPDREMFQFSFQCVSSSFFCFSLSVLVTELIWD